MGWPSVATEHNSSLAGSDLQLFLFQQFAHKEVVKCSGDYVHMEGQPPPPTASHIGNSKQPLAVATLRFSLPSFC